MKLQACLNEVLNQETLKKQFASLARTELTLKSTANSMTIKYNGTPLLVLQQYGLTAFTEVSSELTFENLEKTMKALNLNPSHDFTKTLNTLCGRLKHSAGLIEMRKGIYSYVKGEYGNRPWHIVSTKAETEKLKKINSAAIEGYQCKGYSEEQSNQTRYQLNFSKEGRQDANIEVIIIKPKNPKENAPFILYFPSGGYFLDLSESDIIPMSKIAEKARFPIYDNQVPVSA